MNGSVRECGYWHPDSSVEHTAENCWLRPWADEEREAPPVIGGRPAREAAIEECRRRIREAAERHEGETDAPA